MQKLMPTLRATVMTGSLLLAGRSIPATAQSVTACPAAIETQQSLTSKYSEWSATTDQTQSPLVSIRFSDGDPKDLAWLVPDKTSKDGIQEWVLAPSNRGYWVSCGYANTTIILSRRLDPRYKKCTVSLDTSFMPPLATRYQCQ
jgi:hypothetical protein